MLNVLLSCEHVSPHPAKPHVNVTLLPLAVLPSGCVGVSVPGVDATHVTKEHSDDLDSASLDAVTDHVNVLLPTLSAGSVKLALVLPVTGVDSVPTRSVRLVDPWLLLELQGQPKSLTELHL